RACLANAAASRSFRVTAAAADLEPSPHLGARTNQVRDAICISARSPFARAHQRRLRRRGEPQFAATVLQVAATVLQLAETVLQLAATVLQADATVLHAAATVLHFEDTVLHVEATVLHFDATVLHLAAIVLQVAATVPAHRSCESDGASVAKLEMLPAGF